MRIVISSGHGKYVRGAKGYLDEVDEARKVVERVAAICREVGVGVQTFHDNTSTSQNQNLQTIVNYHNSQQRDLDVSVHFNAYQTTAKPMGTETLYVTQQTLATTVSKKIAQAGGLINRGAKYRGDLYFLNNTKMPSVLIEVAFVDSSTDANLYTKNFDNICAAIVEGLTGVTVGAPPETAPPEPETPPPDEVTARVKIDIQASGDVIVTINGQDFMVTAPGPEQPSKPVFPPNQTNIICSVFGGSKDPNDSAYPPYDKITDKESSCALPWRFEGERPLVRVLNVETNTEVICQIRDLGPWVVDDEYWAKGTRPIAEQSYLNKTPLPYGPNKGKVANGAGIDITPAAAKAIGLSGMGKVNWAFVDKVPTV